MKNGDKVLCYQSLTLECEINDTCAEYVLFIKDKEYVLDSVYVNDVCFVDEYDERCYFVIKYNCGSHRLFDNYFITQKQLRKIKLEKINEKHIG